MSKKQYARLKVLIRIGNLPAEEIASSRVEMVNARNMIRRLSQRAIINSAFSN